MTQGRAVRFSCLSASRTSGSVFNGWYAAASDAKPRSNSDLWASYWASSRRRLVRLVLDLQLGHGHGLPGLGDRVLHVLELGVDLLELHADLIPVRRVVVVVEGERVLLPLRVQPLALGLEHQDLVVQARQPVLGLEDGLPERLRLALDPLERLGPLLDLVPGGELGRRGGRVCPSA